MFMLKGGARANNVVAKYRAMWEMLTALRSQLHLAFLKAAIAFAVRVVTLLSATVTMLGRQFKIVEGSGIEVLQAMKETTAVAAEVAPEKKSSGNCGLRGS